MTGSRLAFELPACLEAASPPESRGVARDAVRLLVTRRGSDELVHARFSELPSFLDPGDLVVVNASATLPAALEAEAGGSRIVVHLSTWLDERTWVVELRRRAGGATERWSGEVPGQLRLAGGGTARIVAPYRGSPRLHVARLSVPGEVRAFLERHGKPIRYRYVPEPWPLASYQTVYATEPGSAEMPSAGRPFTADVIAALVARGIGVTPVVLHTGVASLEAGELPYPERASVPGWTAARVNATRRHGGRVVAVGTTVVRALETAVRDDGSVGPFEGWTERCITPEHPPVVVDGLVTGWHEPETSHLLLLEAVAGRPTLERAYATALEERYLFHEFGDSHLVLP